MYNEHEKETIWRNPDGASYTERQEISVDEKRDLDDVYDTIEACEAMRTEGHTEPTKADSCELER